MLTVITEAYLLYLYIDVSHINYQTDYFVLITGGLNIVQRLIIQSVYYEDEIFAIDNVNLTGQRCKAPEINLLQGTFQRISKSFSNLPFSKVGYFQRETRRMFKQICDQIFKITQYSICSKTNKFIIVTIIILQKCVLNCNLYILLSVEFSGVGTVSCDFEINMCGYSSLSEHTQLNWVITDTGKYWLFYRHIFTDVNCRYYIYRERVPVYRIPHCHFLSSHRVVK